MEDVKITVVIPTYRRPDKLKRALRSVLNQSFQEFEIIVVDDNENERYIIENQKVIDNFNDPRIRKINNDKNLGACASRNKGIRSSLTNYIAFLDDDDEWRPSFLNETYKILCNTNDLTGIIYTGYSIVNHEYKVKKEFDSGFYRGNVFLELLNGWCPASTSLFLIKKNCFNQVGLFDENLPSFQDYDMWLRLATKFHFEYINKSLVIKNDNEGSEQITTNPYKRQEGLNKILEKWEGVITDKLGKKGKERFLRNFLKTIYENKIKINLKQNKKRHSLKLIKEYVSKCNYDIRLVFVFILSVIINYKFYILTKIIWHRIKGFNMNTF